VQKKRKANVNAEWRKSRTLEEIFIRNFRRYYSPITCMC